MTAKTDHRFGKIWLAWYHRWRRRRIENRKRIEIGEGGIECIPLDELYGRQHHTRYNHGLRDPSITETTSQIE
jgi:hypothetical protein